MHQTLHHNPVLEFSVSYSLSEYLSIVKDHLPSALAAHYSRRGKPFKGLPRLANLFLIPIGSVVFLFKKRRMPVCHFTINDERIKRITQDGVLEIPWTDVVAVHCYTQGYLVQKSEGALPLPYRCLTKGQKMLFEAFIQRWKELQK